MPTMKTLLVPKLRRARPRRGKASSPPRCPAQPKGLSPLRLERAQAPRRLAHPTIPLPPEAFFMLRHFSCFVRLVTPPTGCLEFEVVKNSFRPQAACNSKLLIL